MSRGGRGGARAGARRCVGTGRAARPPGPSRSPPHPPPPALPTMCCPMLMARAHTRAYDVLALRHGYHGGGDATAGLTAQSTWKFEVPQARAGAGGEGVGWCVCVSGV